MQSRVFQGAERLKRWKITFLVQCDLLIQLFHPYHICFFVQFTEYIPPWIWDFTVLGSNKIPDEEIFCKATSSRPDNWDPVKASVQWTTWRNSKFSKYALFVVQPGFCASWSNNSTTQFDRKVGGKRQKVWITNWSKEKGKGNHFSKSTFSS